MTDFAMTDTMFNALVTLVIAAATANLIDPDLRAMAGSRDAVILALVSAGIAPASSFEL